MRLVLSLFLLLMVQIASSAFSIQDPPPLEEQLNFVIPAIPKARVPVEANLPKEFTEIFTLNYKKIKSILKSEKFRVFLEHLELIKAKEIALSPSSHHSQQQPEKAEKTLPPKVFFVDLENRKKILKTLYLYGQKLLASPSEDQLKQFMYVHSGLAYVLDPYLEFHDIPYKGLFRLYQDQELFDHYLSLIKTGGDLKEWCTRHAVSWEEMNPVAPYMSFLWGEFAPLPIVSEKGVFQDLTLGRAYMKHVIPFAIPWGDESYEVDGKKGGAYIFFIYNLWDFSLACECPNPPKVFALMSQGFPPLKTVQQQRLCYPSLDIFQARYSRRLSKRIPHWRTAGKNKHFHEGHEVKKGRKELLASPRLDSDPHADDLRHRSISSPAMKEPQPKLSALSAPPLGSSLPLAGKADSPMQPKAHNLSLEQRLKLLIPDVEKARAKEHILAEIPWPDPFKDIFHQDYAKIKSRLESHHRNQQTVPLENGMTSWEESLRVAETLYQHGLNVVQNPSSPDQMKHWMYVYSGWAYLLDTFPNPRSIPRKSLLTLFKDPQIFTNYFTLIKKGGNLESFCTKSAELLSKDMTDVATCMNFLWSPLALLPMLSEEGKLKPETQDHAYRHRIIPFGIPWREGPYEMKDQKGGTYFFLTQHLRNFAVSNGSPESPLEGLKLSALPSLEQLWKFPLLPYPSLSPSKNCTDGKCLQQCIQRDRSWTKKPPLPTSPVLKQAIRPPANQIAQDNEEEMQRGRSATLQSYRKPPPPTPSSSPLSNSLEGHFPAPSSIHESITFPQ